jgi:hypothetical protein
MSERPTDASGCSSLLPTPHANSGTGSGTSGRAGGRDEHSDGGGESAPDASGDGRHEWRSESARLERRPDVAVSGGEPAPDAVRGGRGWDQGDPGRSAVEQVAADGDRPTGVDWGVYTAAVRHWELITGVPAPHPVTTGARGARVLAPELPEWMMGVPAGRITATAGLSRNQKLRLAGNGVMPAQAEHAIRLLVTIWNRWNA